MRIAVVGRGRGPSSKFTLPLRQLSNSLNVATCSQRAEVVQAYWRAVGTTYAFGSGFWKGRWYLGGWYNFNSYIYYTPLNGNPLEATWSSVTGQPTSASGASYLRSFVGNDSRMMAWIPTNTYSPAYRIYVTEDGTTFTPQVGIPGIYTIACNNDIFVAAGVLIFGYTVDGATWTSQAVTGTWYALCWSPTFQKFVAISTTGLIRYSDDGMTWTTAVQGPTGDFRCVVDIGGKLLASGTNVLMESTDGVNWTSLTPFSSYTISRIARADQTGICMAVALDAVAPLYWSKDGITWNTATAYGRPKYDVSTDGRAFLYPIYGGSVTIGYWDGHFGKIVPAPAGMERMLGAGVNQRWNGMQWAGDVTLGEGGSGDFTVSCTFGMSTASGGRQLLRSNPSGGTTYWCMFVGDSGGASNGSFQPTFYVYNAGSRVLALRPSSYFYSWPGVRTFRVTRSGNTFKAYLNNTVIATVTSSVVLPTCTDLLIGDSVLAATMAGARDTLINNVFISNKAEDPKQIAAM